MMLLGIVFPVSSRVADALHLEEDTGEPEERKQEDIAETEREDMGRLRTEQEILSSVRETSGGDLVERHILKERTEPKHIG